MDRSRVPRILREPPLNSAVPAAPARSPPRLTTVDRATRRVTTSLGPAIYAAENSVPQHAGLVDSGTGRLNWVPRRFFPGVARRRDLRPNGGGHVIEERG